MCVHLPLYCIAWYIEPIMPFVSVAKTKREKKVKNNNNNKNTSDVKWTSIYAICVLLLYCRCRFLLYWSDLSLSSNHRVRVIYAIERALKSYTRYMVHKCIYSIRYFVRVSYAFDSPCLKIYFIGIYYYIEWHFKIVVCSHARSGIDAIERHKTQSFKKNTRQRKRNRYFLLFLLCVCV